MSIPGRRASPLRHKGGERGGELVHHEFEGVETRNGVPLSRPYVRRAVPDSPWRVELAMIRQRAAVLCGLAEYPGELVRVTERLARSPAVSYMSPQQIAQLEARRAELQTAVRKMSPEG